MIRGFPRHAASLPTPFFLDSSQVQVLYSRMLPLCYNHFGVLLDVQFESISPTRWEHWALRAKSLPLVDCRFEYIKMMHGDASLWESLPKVLERRAGTRRYVGAFRAPFQDLRLTPQQEHALRACSLLAIPPPPPGQEVLPGGVPEDLSQDNLSAWLETVQDVAAGMIAPRPEMSLTIFPQVVEVLTILELVSRVTFCRQCYLPRSTCRYLGGSFTASTASTTGPSWSEIADPTFGPNSASARESAGSAPPYGSLATAGGSIWDPPSVDYPRLPGAATAIRQPRPPSGRASHLESQLKAIRYGNTAPPDPLRLPTPTWVPPTMQNR